MSSSSVTGKTLAAAFAMLAGALLTPAAAVAAPTHDGWMIAERMFDFDRDQAGYDAPQRNWGNSWYGAGRDENVAGWAIGTFRGKNSGNGLDETVTIHPDGSAEMRTRDQPPRYGSFAGETLTFGTRISRVQPARGGIVIDGAYYYR